MNVKNYVRALLCLYLTLSLHILAAQALKVGDHLPEELWNMPLTVINHPEGKETVTLSEYKDKLIILDFWATWCGPCVKKFPEIGIMQKEFGNQLSFVGMTVDNKERISSFLKKYLSQDNSRFVPVTTVSAAHMQKYFPHKGIPHYVWINRANQIQAITYEADVTRDNVALFVKGESFHYTPKIDRMDFNYEAPLFINNNGGEGKNIRFRSVLTGPVEGVGFAASRYLDEYRHKIGRMFGLNCTITQLFGIAYPEMSFYPRTRVLLDSKEPEKLRFEGEEEEYEKWKEENVYTYEIIAPPASAKEIKQMIAGDFLRFWGLRGYFEEREIDCLVLKATEKLETRRSDSSAAPYHNLYDIKEEKQLLSYPMSFMVSYLNDNQSMHVIDETNFNGNLDISLPANVSDTKYLMKHLENSGFHASIEKRTIQVFIITDK